MLAPFVAGELTIEPRQAASGEPIELFWRGRSSDRNPTRTVVPFVSDVLVAARTESCPVRLHFETIEHMNSSTITAIIQIIQQARSQGTRLVLTYDGTKNWQRLSFEALSVFVKDDGLLELVRERG